MGIRDLVESVRCLKHNLLDRAPFSLTFRRGLYFVQTADHIRMRFRKNPYLALYEVLAGYLRNSATDLKPGMCVIDAGACYGEFALYASLRVGSTGRVFALEPDPENFRCLRETFELNGGIPDNVTLLPFALWKESGRLAFSPGNQLNSKVEQIASESGTGVTSDPIIVTARSLSDLASSYKLTHVDYIKMDIEGAEIEALEGAARMMSTLKPTFAIASYHKRDGRPTAETLEKLFNELGYRTETGFPSHLTTYASPLN